MKDLAIKIQNFLNLKADGVIGNITLKAISDKLGCSNDLKSIQSFVGVGNDGILGILTLTAIANKLGINHETSNITSIPKKAIDLILDSEGIDQPYKWPGGGSGITLGYGCDIGADPSSLNFWIGILPDNQIELLKQALGKTGRSAAEIQTRFKSINVTQAQALQVFMMKSLPIEIRRTLNAFPGLELMPPEVLGAMVSLVYNRGTDLTGNRRTEMKTIHDLLVEFSKLSDDLKVKNKNSYIEKISEQFKKMKRLWIGQGLDGLLVRRDAEASLCCGGEF